MTASGRARDDARQHELFPNTYGHCCFVIAPPAERHGRCAGVCAASTAAAKLALSRPRRRIFEKAQLTGPATRPPSVLSDVDTRYRASGTSGGNDDDVRSEPRGKTQHTRLSSALPVVATGRTLTDIGSGGRVDQSSDQGDGRSGRARRHLSDESRLPKHLHDLHSDSHAHPSRRWCSIASRATTTSTPPPKIPPASRRRPAKKLTCDLTDKLHYTVHYCTLQVDHRLGLELQSIDKVLMFEQRLWLRGFVQHNAAKRQAAITAESDHAKLKCISVGGKLLERKRDRIKYRLVANPKIVRKITSKSCYKRSTINTEDVYAEGPETETGSDPSARERHRRHEAATSRGAGGRAHRRRL